MPKNVLIIGSSPRACGNSETLSMAFAKGAEEAGHTVEMVLLRDKHISNCVACNSCYQTHRCIIQDDTIEILEKMKNADTIVLSSPVYFYTVNASMKQLIDRCYSIYTELTNKEFYFIVTAADTNENMLERAVECFRGFIDCLEGAKEKGVILGSGLSDKEDASISSLNQLAHMMGKRL